MNERYSFFIAFCVLPIRQLPIPFDKKIMISVAAKRSIQYDIRFIVESKFITKQALKFVEILGKDE